MIRKNRYLDSVQDREVARAAMVTDVMEGKEWKERFHSRKRKGDSWWRKNHSGEALPKDASNILQTKTARGRAKDIYQSFRLFFSFLKMNLM